METETEQQLINMGFPIDLIKEALSLTNNDLQKSTDWLLTHNTNSPQSPSSTPPNIQPKINRFFHSQFTKKPNQHQIEIQQDPSSPIPLKKRPRSSHIENYNKNTPHALHAPNMSSAHAPHAPPLSERMRPRVIDEVVGQDHLLSQNSLLRCSISQNRLPSIILWGPPGTGKTSIAKAIVSSIGSSYRFVSLSAVTCGVKDVRECVEEAKKAKIKSNKRTVLFLDEVHRFNKAQQDSFLPVIEDGSIVFVGATTENPSFHLITPLLSRCRVLTLNALKPGDLVTLLRRAVLDLERGVCCNVGGGVRVEVSDDAIEFLSLHCDGDARVCLNALEIACTTAIGRVNDVEVNALVNPDDVKEALQCKHLAYDRAGEEHYNLISALHKSIRGSDANASIYWLARMIEGGEEPLYIARRLIRCASEDIGLSDPQALVQAVACYQACHLIGKPECNAVLAQCVAYLALAPKSIAVYKAIEAAQKAVRESVGQNEGVPLHLRNAPTKLMKDVGYGKGYIYTPDDPNVPQSFLPPSLQGYKFLNWP